MFEDERFMIPIPGNIKLRMEVINGVGIKELMQTFIAGAIGVILAFILNSIFHNYLVAIGTFFVITGGTFVIVMKDKNNSSIGDLIGFIVNFYKGQRFFKFVIKEEDLNDNKQTEK